MNKQTDISSSIAARQLDNAMYSGEKLSDDFFDDIDSSTVDVTPYVERIAELEQERDNLLIQLENTPTTNAITQIENGELTIPDIISFTRTGIQFHTQLSHKEWEEVGKFLGRLNTSIQWIVGDWIAYGEVVYGETYEQASKLVRRSVKTLQNWCYVCSSVEISRRREDLSFTHHTYVAALSPEDQEHFLKLASNNRLSVKKLNEQIAASKADIISPSPTDDEPVNPLANRRTIRTIHRVWRKVSSGAGDVKPEDIELIEKWLEQVKRTYQ
jgi:hypothetical protein